MAKRKAVQDAEVAEKTIEKGLLIVHTGPGKGKSTAAFGLALRMLGRGRRVGVVQFIKGAWHTAERDALAAFGDQVAWHTMGEGFTWETQDRARDVAAAERAWGKSRELMADPSFGLVILDELNIALRYEYLDLASVVAALQRAARRAARRRHRPQRQAGADRGRRPRDRDDARQAPLRRRREGASRHRVLRRMSSPQKAPSFVPSRACGGGLGRGPAAVRLERTVVEALRACSPREVNGRGKSPLPIPPPQAGEGGARCQAFRDQKVC